MNICGRKAILDSVLKYPELFNKILGYTIAITHKIDTGDAASLRQNDHGDSLVASRVEVFPQISEMLEW